jgi:hypothetical protein
MRGQSSEVQIMQVTSMEEDEGRVWEDSREEEVPQLLRNSFTGILHI